MGREKGKGDDGRLREYTNEVECVYLHFRRDVARADCIYLYIVLTPFIAESLRELPEGTFSRSICWDGEATLEGEKRTKVYYLAATKGNHVSPSSLGEKPYSLQVHVEDLGSIRTSTSEGMKKERVGPKWRCSTYIVPIILGEINTR